MTAEKETITLRLTPPVPAPAERSEMTAEDREAVRLAVQRELQAGGVTWDEIKDLTLSDLASANQDALIDDMFEGHPDDRPHIGGMVALIGTYDRLLGTNRAAELDRLDDLPAQDAASTPKIGVPYAWTDPETGAKTCPECQQVFPETYDADDKPVTFNYATHYQREHEGEIDHAQCPPGSHTFDAGDDHYEGRVDEHGNQVCNDCGTPMFYCTVDNRYHHVQQPGEDPVEPCFLIQEQAWPVPAPQPGEHAYDLSAGWHCFRHESNDSCPPLDTAVLTRATAYPAPPEPETCYCGGKVRYGRCRECGTLYGQREEDS